MRPFLFTALLLGAVPLAPLAAQVTLDLEGGAAFAGYNDVRIPGAGGTRFSLTDDLATATSGAGRAQLAVTLGGRHTLRVTAAPLRLAASGAFGAPVLFNGVPFGAGAPVAARWRFDTYRLTYRYAFVRAERLRVEGGATILLRDAEVALTSGGTSSSFTNRGVVPLLSLAVRWRAAGPVTLLLDADGLAAPQGRAFDASVAAEVPLTRGLAARVGYRAIEGGVNNDRTFNFSLTHLAVAGLTIHF